MNEEKEFDIHIWDAAAPDGDYAEAGLMKLLTIAEEKYHYIPAAAIELLSKISWVLKVATYFWGQCQIGTYDVDHNNHI